jgi:hypothetical protein
MRTSGVLRTIHTSPGQQAGEIRDTDAKHLIGQDVVDAII